MSNQRVLERSPTLVLGATTAAEMMTPNPLSVREDASIHEAEAFLIDKAVSGAPVIDAAGRPVGVVSQFDLLVHDREKVDYLTGEEPGESPAALKKHWRGGFQVERVDRTCVRDVMTPVVFTAAPDWPAGRVIEQMLARKIHRLFVVDENGVLVGVISPMDVLRRLRYPEPSAM